MYVVHAIAYTENVSHLSNRDLKTARCTEITDQGEPILPTLGSARSCGISQTYHHNENARNIPGILHCLPLNALSVRPIAAGPIELAL
jgi:hypothetical protein